MVVLFFGDIFGKPGRRAIRKALPDLKAKYQPDFLLGNAENLAGGRGVNRRVYAELLDLGFHGFTSGNHIWDNREVLTILDTDPRLLRPANYPTVPGLHTPGRGYHLFESGGNQLFVINLLGRVFMDAVDCPFQAVDKILKDAPKVPVFVDMHCDATSEKYAMGWHLAGRVSVVVGTHSHVQTADARLLPGGTAYITDVGMTGAFDSVIGMKPPEIVRKFLTKRHSPFIPAKDNPGVSCIVATIGDDRKATSIERLRFEVDLDGGLDEERDLE